MPTTGPSTTRAFQSARISEEFYKTHPKTVLKGRGRNFELWLRGKYPSPGHVLGIAYEPKKHRPGR